jgi:DNA-binding CsgD family transcriptional regulator
LGELLGDEQYRGMVLHAQALVDAHLGRAESARAAVEEADAISAAVSDAIVPIWNLAALGHLELSLGNLEAAAGHLRALPARLVSLGWNDPADSVWPDTIEVLIGIGELEQARTYLDLYEQRAERSGSAWALACAARCRGLLLGAKGDFSSAFESLEHALAEHESVESPFELARTLLALGSVRRRSKQKRAAREVLEQARAAFEEMGAASWAERARAELARIGGRRPSTKELTETEERVASLAAQGRSNKEIASELYMSVHTVEAHLSRIYRKLGVRSRAELAGRRPEPGDRAAKV